ncbi:MAG: hypothetical protein ACRD1J_00755 [Terriglobia bacterium]
MCDYSLMTVPNRLAENGENLIVYKFPTGSRGFASQLDWRKTQEPVKNQQRQGFWQALRRSLLNLPSACSVPAVCIPPGARLRLQDIPARLKRQLEIGPVEDVTFTELTAIANNYRDAVVFQNGRHILLQELEEGQRAKVLDLSSAEAIEPYEEWSESRR